MGNEDDDDIIILSSDDESSSAKHPPPSKKLKPTPKKESSDEHRPSLVMTNGTASTTTSMNAMQTNNNNNNADVIDIDDDEIQELIPPAVTSTQGPSTSGHHQSPRERVEGAVEDLVYSLRSLLKPKERTKVKEKLFKKLGKIDSISETTANELINQVVEKTRLIRSTPKKKWADLGKLFAYIEKYIPPATQSSSSSNSATTRTQNHEETPEERKERKKKEQVEILEKKLKDIEKEIEKWDKKPVDLDDDRNSAYLVRTRMVTKYIKVFQILCQETECNTYTGRPIEKKIKLPHDVTRFPEANAAVEKFINSKDILFIPDYHDIESIVQGVNNSNPVIPTSETSEVAKTLFNKLIKIMRSRRHQDFEIAVNLSSVQDDPAENDEELRKKLEENSRQHKSEKDVIESFVQKQNELQEAAKEIPGDERVDESAGESDDESEEDDASAENDDDDDELHIEGVKNGNSERTVCTRDQASDDSDDEKEEEEEEETTNETHGEEEIATNETNGEICNTNSINGT